MDSSNGLYQITVMLCFIEMSLSLECWHCIGDMCNIHPSEVDNAETRSCSTEESCQKVYYLGEYKGEIYESTVRSCSSGVCVDRNDFENCTRDLQENPGCMRRLCCNQNKCNGEGHVSWSHAVIPAILTSILQCLWISWRMLPICDTKLFIPVQRFENLYHI